MSEETMVRNCAPTLAGIKTGNLFSCTYSSAEEMRSAVRKWNRRLNKKGVRILPLRYRDHSALIYVYRPAHLTEDLKDGEACRILAQCGYRKAPSEQCVVQLIRRLRECDGFPHEIGLFLGYPPEDVSGFIEQKACGYKCVGCWKVYGDEQKCRRLFAQYKQCTAAYESLLKKGRDVPSMTVAEA